MLAADSRGTIGDPRGLTAIRDTHVKIFHLSKYVGIVSYGSSELAAQLIEEIRKQLDTSDIYVDPILNKTREVLRSRYQDWFKAFPIKERPGVGFILGGYNEDKTMKTYYLSSSLDFAPQLATNVAMGGIPQYATYLVHRLFNPDMCREHLIPLAVYVISETATQDPKVGGPIRVVEISMENGYIELEESEVEEVMEHNEEQNKKLREFFFKGGEEKIGK